MQFVEGQGLWTTKAELAALCSFCEGSDRFANVTVKIEAGKLTAWSANGASALWHFSDTTNGAGEPSKLDLVWAISGSALKGVAKTMSKKDEVCLRVDKGGKMTHADVRAFAQDEEVSATKLTIDLRPHVNHQLLLDLATVVPQRPTVEAKIGHFGMSFAMLARLGPVTKTIETDPAIRIYPGATELEKVYCEIDKTSRLFDQESARWVAVLMPYRVDRAGDESESACPFPNEQDPNAPDPLVVDPAWRKTLVEMWSAGRQDLTEIARVCEVTVDVIKEAIAQRRHLRTHLEEVQKFVSERPIIKSVNDLNEGLRSLGKSIKSDLAAIKEPGKGVQLVSQSLSSPGAATIAKLSVSVGKDGAKVVTFVDSQAADDTAKPTQDAIQSVPTSTRKSRRSKRAQDVSMQPQEGRSKRQRKASRKTHPPV